MRQRLIGFAIVLRKVVLDELTSIVRREGMLVHMIETFCVMLVQAKRFVREAK